MWHHDSGRSEAGAPGQSHGGWRYVPDAPGFNVVGGPQAAFSWGGLAKGALGVLTSAIPGPIDDVIVGAAVNRFSPQPQPFAPQPGPCGPGTVRIGNNCVRPSAALPGGDPFVTPASVPAGQSMFGLYTNPSSSTRQVRRCGPGLVLGKDGLCYSSTDLPNRLRMYPKRPKPPITARQYKTLTTAESVVKKIKGLNKKAGLRVPTKKKK